MSESQQGNTILSGGEATAGTQPGTQAAAQPANAGTGAEAGPAWLPEDLRADPALREFKDIAALAKTYKETKAFVGADKADLLRIPKDEAAPEWADVYSKLGRPAKPEDYKLAAPDGTAPEVVTAFSAQAHALGLSGKQATEVLGFYGKAVADQAQALEQAVQTETQQTQAALKTEWGQAFDEKIHGITRLLENAGGKEALDAFNAIGGGRNPALLRALGKILDGVAEPSTLRGGGGGGMGRAMTPADGQAAIAEKHRDQEFMKAYTSKAHPAHNQAVAEMGVLYAAAYPEPT